MYIRILWKGPEKVSNRQTLLMPLLFKFVKGFMLFIRTVTSETAEVRLKREARAWFTFVWGCRLVLFMGMFTFARRTPLQNIETFSSRQPIHTYLFRPPWNEFKSFAWTTGTLCFLSFFCYWKIMFREHVATEAAGIWSNSKTILFACCRSPSNIYTPLGGFFSVLKLPRQHLFRSWSYSKLLHTLHYCSLVSSFNHFIITNDTFW